MTKKLIVGNWKMNPATVEDAKRIAGKTRRVAARTERVHIVVCPPLPFIAACVPRRGSENFHVGAQSVSSVGDVGPHTGEVDAVMLESLGVEYAIVGHSEQRAMGDTDATVCGRLANALAAGLAPILCVGEVSRDQGGDYLEALKNQIKGSLSEIPKKYARRIILAYEPVWAIGAKEAMKPEDIHETSLFIKKTFADVFGPEAGVKVRVLYGGAVNFRNAREIITTGKVDGLLVGRESVNMPGFVELIKAVDGVK